MNNAIKKIIEGTHIDEIMEYSMNRLFVEGPVSITVLEILTYLNMFEPEYFNLKKDDILEYMGVFYKSVNPHSLAGSIFSIYGDYINQRYGVNYTPVQASIIKKINENKNFSFSAPTSTGKSFVFRNIIEQSNRDMVIIVPSRALINEYFDRVCKLVDVKSVNVLTFVDKINTKNAQRNVFILTPERAKELFKYKSDFDIELFLFDEAQLSNEESTRGLYFDSIVRRIQKSFTESKSVFAHPFVKNPNAQFIKNNIDLHDSMAFQYKQKNVGQIFYTHEKNEFYHFGIEKYIMGSRKMKCEIDPLMKTIINNGSILIYTTKASIYNKKVFNKFNKYIEICEVIINKEALSYIEELSRFIGVKENMHSNMIEMLKKGIVIHHGSLPLQARLILERFTQKGFCKICFATSTLEQGINMPFDVVYLNTFQASKPLSLKNLIGRAGRSTDQLKFDFGGVIIHQQNMSKFRNIMQTDEELSEISLLDTNDILNDDDYIEFKEAINSGTFSDEFNLTDTEVKRLGCDDIGVIVEKILDSLFKDQILIPLKTINADIRNKLDLYQHYEELYTVYLNGRKLSDGERSVLNTAIKILLWKVHCKTFKEICWNRYSYAARLKERMKLKREYELEETIKGKKQIKSRANNLFASFISGYADLPNKELQNYSMLGNREVKAKDVDYDRIVFDTYDYLDKLIGFKLNDVFYAIFFQYYKKTLDERSYKLSKYIKYGTDDQKEIWMLRYGFDFEDIEWLKNYIKDINQEEIIFNEAINELSDDQKYIIKRFL